MKYALYLLAFIFIFTGCRSEEDEPQSEGVGTLSVSVGIDIKATPIGGRSEDIIPLEDFRVIIENEDGSTFIEYARAAEVPETIELPTGVYKVVAFSDNDEVAEFENPYYYGESEIFSIAKEEFKTIDVTCGLANMMVTVTYSDNVVATFSNYSTVVSSDAGGALVFNEAETRPAHFRVSPLSIEAVLTFTNPDGSTITKNFTGAVTDPQPKTHYRINVDATVQDGQIVINLMLDESLDVVEILLNENLCNCPTGQVCIDFTPFGDQPRCVEVCSTTPCPDGLTCSLTQDGVTSVCLDLGGCNSINDCPEGYGCYFGLCFPNNGDVDVDGDGYFSEELGGGDCIDTDASVNPGAQEICTDGLDNDCDGLIDALDPDAVDCTECTFNGDCPGGLVCSQGKCVECATDSDCPFGACQNGECVEIDQDEDGFTVSDGDCDDNDSTVYPGAPEICDSIDNNCDGVADDGISVSYYPDLDGDGYGDPNGVIIACSAGPEYTTNNLDCDDDNSTVYPGAPEQQDGLDNNCDGIVDNAVCGNGVVDFGEECDGQPDCSANCTLI